MSKQRQDPIKPTTKASYAMQISQTSNRFEVLGKTPQPSSSNPQKFAYYTKESILVLHILETDHILASGEISTKKIFQNDKYFGVLQVKYFIHCCISCDRVELRG